MNDLLDQKTSCDEQDSAVRKFCQGMPPLNAKLSPWMTNVVSGEQLADLVDRHGSPLNLVETDGFANNVAQLKAVAASRDVDFAVYFARKANKCLCFVDAAREAKCGVDTASLNELKQTIARGVPVDDVVCTAAIKSDELIRYAIEKGVLLVVDNADEWNTIVDAAKAVARTAHVQLRLSGFVVNNAKLFSRFGFDVEQVIEFVSASMTANVQIEGLHFHLDGYCKAERVAAVEQTVSIANHLRQLGHPVTAIDMGGGFPVRYLESESQWNTFWREHARALLDQSDTVTYADHPLGFVVHNGEIVGQRQTYPFWQPLEKEEWLAEILDSGSGESTIAALLKRERLQLRCEPGRALLDGCGLTAARVEFRKQTVNGDHLIGVAMNRTQCRTSSADFLVDPLVVAHRKRENHAAIEGFLVGAYCTESELLCLRKLKFPHGVERGDIVVFPNTAGYFMHFLESRSHQFPLAKNVVANDGWPLDPIDHADSQANF